MLKTILAISLVASALALSGCGGAQEGGGDGFLAIEIEDSRQPEGLDVDSLALPGAKEAVNPIGKDASNPLIVSNFRVTITGEGIETPLITEADGAAGQIQVLGISPGKRNILIEASNDGDEVIRRRLIEEVEINAGVVTPIKTSLNTIPVILNFKDNACVLSSYFRVYGFGEPGTTLLVKSVSDGSGEVSLSESTGGESVVVSPSVSTGLFEFRPDRRVAGKQKILLVDEATGESSSKTVTLVDAEDRPGFQFVSAGAHGPAVTLGTAASAAGSVHYPTVLRALIGSDF